MSQLSCLEDQSVFIFREAYNEFADLAMLWSVGKDSTVLLHLARKAFFGRVPFPVVHVDTSYKPPELIAYRDQFAREWDLNLLVAQNREALEAGMNHTMGRLTCCNALKTQALQRAIRHYGFKGIFLGIRRDEEGSRAKERVFSPRDEKFQWNYKDQPPEFWDQYNTAFSPDTHIRIHPLLHWTEMDIWEYVRQEQLPVCRLYFARDGKRFRSLGCMPCNAPIASEASTIDDIIEELLVTSTPERAGRAQDRESSYAMQKLRTLGYM